MATSAAGAGGFPRDGLPQIALAGRSNAGKSSLINALIGKTLARSSQKPGKTRLVNFYRVNDAFYLVDLPGFGYARAGAEVKENMEEVLREYFAAADPRGVLYLADARVADSAVDRAALGYLLRGGHPLLVLAARCDQIPASGRMKALAGFASAHGLPEPPLPVSAREKQGLEAVWEQIGVLLGIDWESKIG